MVSVRFRIPGSVDGERIGPSAVERHFGIDLVGKHPEVVAIRQPAEVLHLFRAGPGAGGVREVHDREEPGPLGLPEHFRRGAGAHPEVLAVVARDSPARHCRHPPAGERDGLHVRGVARVGEQHVLPLAHQRQHGEGDAFLGAAGDEGFRVRIPTDAGAGLLPLHDPLAEPALAEGIERFRFADPGAGGLEHRLRGVGVGIAPAEADHSVETRREFHQGVARVVPARLGQRGPRRRFGRSGPEQQRRGPLRRGRGADRDRLLQAPEPAQQPGRHPEEADPERGEFGEAVERADEHRLFSHPGEKGHAGREEPVAAIHDFDRRDVLGLFRRDDARDDAVRAGVTHRKQIQESAGGEHSRVVQGRRGQGHAARRVAGLRPRPGERDEERFLPPAGDDHRPAGRRPGRLELAVDRFLEFRKARAGRVVGLPAQ